MYYIYCYTNKVNGHTYVGQTNNIERRRKEHRSIANSSNLSKRSSMFHAKLKEYGEDNFVFDILETLDTKSEEIVNEREMYWIEKKESFIRSGKGYNMTLGGDGNRCGEEHRVLNDIEVLALIEDIKSGVDYKALSEKYGLAMSYISMINHGQSFRQKDEAYPLHRYYKSDNDYKELLDLLLYSDLPMTEIASTLEIGYSTVKKINAGTLRRGLWHEYPIRAISPNVRRANRIKELLLRGESNAYITKETGASDETVRRINIGQSHRDDSLSYPLR